VYVTYSKFNRGSKDKDAQIWTRRGRGVMGDRSAVPKEVVKSVSLGKVGKK